MPGPRDIYQYGEKPYTVASQEYPTVGGSEKKNPRAFISGRDMALLIVEAGMVVGATYGLLQFDLFRPYLELLSSSKEFTNILNNLLSNPEDILKKPELFKQYAMLFGFLFGCSENIFLIAYILIAKKLLKTASMNWQSTKTYEIEEETGMRIQRTQCGDPRIDSKKKESVTLGSGYNGGMAFMYMFSGMMLDHIANDGPLRDIGTGYLIGRNFPALIYQGLSDFSDMIVESWFRRNKGAIAKKHVPHNCGCAMCAIGNEITHFLKQTTGEKHEGSIKLLDTLSQIPRFVNKIAYEPAANVVLAAFSLFGYIIRPSGEVMGIQETVTHP